jgi:AcrR family transcriptional regulator
MSKRQTTLHARVSAAILDAAAAVLAERGEQASMADVAAAAGMARATVYRYFPNREALFEALGRLAVEQAGERLQAGRLRDIAVPETFERAVRALVAGKAVGLIQTFDKTSATANSPTSTRRCWCNLLRWRRRQSSGRSATRTGRVRSRPVPSSPVRPNEPTSATAVPRVRDAAAKGLRFEQGQLGAFEAVRK